MTSQPSAQAHRTHGVPSATATINTTVPSHHATSQLPAPHLQGIASMSSPCPPFATMCHLQTQDPPVDMPPNSANPSPTSATKAHLKSIAPIHVAVTIATIATGSNPATAMATLTCFAFAMLLSHSRWSAHFGGGLGGFREVLGLQMRTFTC